jgi:CrcB protein
VERVLLIALGGALGTVARYVASVLAIRWLGADFPYGTLVVNVAGSFAIGLVQEMAADSLLVPDHLRLFLTTGVLGGLTTYSTFSYETVRLVEARAWLEAAVNAGATTALCFSVCFLGIAVGRLLLALRG